MTFASHWLSESTMIHEGKNPLFDILWAIYVHILRDIQCSTAKRFSVQFFKYVLHGTIYYIANAIQGMSQKMQHD